MNNITNLENFIYNVGECVYTTGEDYTVYLNDSIYFLDKQNLLLKNNYNEVKITNEIKEYIIEKCLEDIPF